MEASRASFDYIRTMKLGPDIAAVAALIGDPARANMLVALLGGQALTAGELAREAGVTAQTASHHIARLEAAGLLTPRKQGRNRYLALGGPEVAQVLEALLGMAEAKGQMRTRPGPKEPALRHARVCYDHLAGDLGVRMYDALAEQGALMVMGEGLELTPRGVSRMEALGVAIPQTRGSQPLCRPCLDWSERRSHLGGPLGRAVLSRLFELGWAEREADTRVVQFKPSGMARFETWLS
jgi:DNA-binding transcriptional ArsR family regulator